jgi:hypothetical protein
MGNSTNVSSRNVILLTLAVGLGAQIPTSIQAIQDPVYKVIAQVTILVVVILVSIKVTPTEDIPRAPSSPDLKDPRDPEPTTIPDPSKDPPK